MCYTPLGRASSRNRINNHGKYFDHCIAIRWGLFFFNGCRGFYGWDVLERRLLGCPSFSFKSNPNSINMYCQIYIVADHHPSWNMTLVGRASWCRTRWRSSTSRRSPPSRCWPTCSTWTMTSCRALSCHTPTHTSTPTSIRQGARTTSPSPSRRMAASSGIVATLRSGYQHQLKG